MTLETKTKAFIQRKSQGRRLPCFINGDLRRGKGVNKVLVYYFNGDGDLIVTIVPLWCVQLREFELI